MHSLISDTVLVINSKSISETNNVTISLCMVGNYTLKSQWISFEFQRIFRKFIKLIEQNSFI